MSHPRMRTITSPRHMRHRPGLAAKVTPLMSSRRTFVVTGAAVGAPATIGAGLATAPAHAAGVAGAPAAAPAAAGTHVASAAALPAKPSASGDVVVLHYGSTGSLVKTAQKRLGKLAVDGQFGPATLARVKAYQRSHHLVVDGYVGPKTWESLGGFPGSVSTPPSKPTPPPSKNSCSVTVVRYGAHGSLVKTVQQRLHITADGNFGPATRSAVKGFQSKHGLSVDGVVGPATWSALGGFPCGEQPAPPSHDVSTVVAIAKQYLGVPYVYGGDDPSGFDCSGLTEYVYAKAGMTIPRTASAQQRALPATGNPVPGDLVFFGTPAYHVGIYLGGNKMIAAPHPGTSVRIQQIWDTPSGYGHFG